MHLFIHLWILSSLFLLGKTYWPDDGSYEDHLFTKTTTSTTIKDETDDSFYYDQTGKESKEEEDDDGDHDHDETTSIIESTTTSTELPSTSSSTSTTTTTTSPQNESSQIEPDYLFIHPDYSPVTLSPKEISYYQSKANRERLFLKLFVILVIIGMSILAAGLLTIHIIQKKRRYAGYNIPANALSKT